MHEKTMTNPLDQIERRVADLERDMCCHTHHWDVIRKETMPPTLPDTPTVAPVVVARALDPVDAAYQHQRQHPAGLAGFSMNYAKMTTAGQDLAGPPPKPQSDTAGGDAAREICRITSHGDVIIEPSATSSELRIALYTTLNSEYRVRQERDDLRKELETARQHLADAMTVANRAGEYRAQIENAKIEHQTDVGKCSATINTLRQQLAEAQREARHYAEANKELNTLLDAMRNQLDEAEKDHDDLYAQLEKADRRSEQQEAVIAKTQTLLSEARDIAKIACDEKDALRCGYDSMERKLANAEDKLLRAKT